MTISQNLCFDFILETEIEKIVSYCISHEKNSENFFTIITKLKITNKSDEIFYCNSDVNNQMEALYKINSGTAKVFIVPDINFFEHINKDLCSRILSKSLKIYRV